MNITRQRIDQHMACFCLKGKVTADQLALMSGARLADNQRALPGKAGILNDLIDSSHVDLFWV